MPVYKNKTKGNWFTKFNYKDWQGETKQKKKEGFKTQREAKEFERKFLNKVKADVDISFSNLIEYYYEDSKTRLKPTTFNNKQYIINNKILPYFGKMPLNTISVTTVRTWQNKLIDDENNYSQTYLKTIHNQLSAIFNYAVKYYNLTENPAAKCGSMGKKNADSMQFWTVDEFERFIAIVESKPTSKVIFELLFWTGMRSGELLALTLNDFILEGEVKSVSVNKNFSRLNGEDLVLEPKTPKSKRIINIPDFLAEIIKNYVGKLYDYEPNQRLFPTTKYYLWHEMKRGCKHSGVKKIRVHDLRHSHASYLIELGFSPLLIAERLGHEKVETTLSVYSHLYPNKQNEVASKLEELHKK
ncbi:site-specific integrase [Carnobacterium pleistocenium]|uniref:site-specific integrase n=1 Tax=Carnobacterium pleistocenium TaxID=181073 RepID=UPI00054D5AFF|nr:site-specific integrase [Carnobacterium pleistocenium]